MAGRGARRCGPGAPPRRRSAARRTARGTQASSTGISRRELARRRGRRSTRAGEGTREEASRPPMPVHRPPRGRHRQERTAQSAATQAVHWVQVWSPRAAHLLRHLAARRATPERAAFWKQDRLHAAHCASPRQFSASWQQQSPTMHWLHRRARRRDRARRRPRRPPVPQWLLSQMIEADAALARAGLAVGARRQAALRRRRCRSLADAGAALGGGARAGRSRRGGTGSSRRRLAVADRAPAAVAGLGATGSRSGVHMPEPAGAVLSCRRSPSSSRCWSLHGLSLPSGEQHGRGRCRCPSAWCRRASLQHCASRCKQGSPCSKHMLAPQVPSALQTEVQHCEPSALQSSPSGRQVAHVSVIGSHAFGAALACRRRRGCRSTCVAGGGCRPRPCTGRCGAAGGGGRYAHAPPSGRQLVGAYAPSVQAPEQHWLAAGAELVPSGEHCWNVQRSVRSLQMPLQHPPGPPHAAPVGWQK